MEDSLFVTELPVLTIKKSELRFKYPYIKSGMEADVYQYNEDIAIKIFDKLQFLKTKKIEKLARLRDPAFLFPKGFVEYSSGFKVGYYMEKVKFGEDFHDFAVLKFLNNLKEKVLLLKMADEAIKRAHKMGIIIGDVKDNNILIDREGNPRFCDTDNFIYAGYDFDLIPSRINWLSGLYRDKYSLVDSDKFVYAVLALEILYGSDICLGYLNFVINQIEDKNVREGFREMLSDSHDKPYVSEILDGIDTDKEFILTPVGTSL